MCDWRLSERRDRPVCARLRPSQGKSSLLAWEGSFEATVLSGCQCLIKRNLEGALSRTSKISLAPVTPQWSVVDSGSLCSKGLA